jgi:hypothetical protein
MNRMSMNLFLVLIVAGIFFVNPADIFATCSQPQYNIWCTNCRTTPTLHISVCIDACTDIEGVILYYQAEGSTGDFDEVHLTQTIPCEGGCQAWVGQTTYNVTGCLKWVLTCGSTVIVDYTTYGDIECCESCE